MYENLSVEFLLSMGNRHKDIESHSRNWCFAIVFVKYLFAYIDEKEKIWKILTKNLKKNTDNDQKLAIQ